MARKIFIWVAHPKAGSFCAALADSYQKGAEAQGAEIRRMELSEMRFDAHSENYGYGAQDLDADLKTWQENVLWADHLLIVHPCWWGAMPTTAKAVLDRALTSGFAYKYHSRGMGWDKLLKGRSADALITADTPTWLDTLIYRKTVRRVLRNQVLAFCGIKPRKILHFGSVKLADAAKINRWIGRAESLGRAAA